MKLPLSLTSAKSGKARKSFALTIFLATILLLGNVNQAFSQSESGYNLLWRISGKGLSKPSYLFGTMHVKDKRAFAFSDSVILAMQKCGTFALETHPDSIIKRMFVTIRGQDSLRSVRRMLSKDDYDKLAQRFEKKNGYPMGDIDPIQAESMLTPEREKTDDKKTFLDAYLFGVARTMHKNTFGLEDAAKQFDDYYSADNPELRERLSALLEDDDEEGQLDATDDLITVYSTGSLKNIVEYLGDDRLADSILIVRNNVMVSSMMKYMPADGLFTAVGVAHLPGDNGIIALLRKQGYTLTPVGANFSNIAERYNTDYTKLKWETFTDEGRGYSMDLPFAPFQTDVLMGMNTVLYPDVANDIFLGAYALLQGAGTKPRSQQVVISDIIKRLKGKPGNRILVNKTVIVNGLKATDVTIDTGEGTGLRYRLFFKNNMLYCLYAGNTLANLNQPYANRFFNSFKAFKPVPQQPKDWITLAKDTGAFSINLPVQPQFMQKELPTQAGAGNMVMKIYMATDTVKLENYLLRYNDYPSGLYLSSAQKSFDAIIEEFKTKGIVITSTQNITKDGEPGMDLTFTMKDYHCRVQLFARGNRIYLLLKQNLTPGTPLGTDDDFFSSFKFTPYLVPTLHPYNFEGGNFAGKIFEDLNMVKDSTPNYRAFFYGKGTAYSVNRTSGALYSIEHANISKYYRAKNADSVYSAMIPEFVSYTDTLLKVDTIKVNGLPGREFITREKKGTARKRFRLFLDNGDMFYITGHQSNAEINSDIENQFYNSIIKTHDTAPIDLASSKAELIAQDLFSPDSITREQAIGALSYYEFEKDELPYVYAAMQKSFPDDSTSYGSRAKLLRLLSTVHDDNAAAELKKLYVSPDVNESIKKVALNVLANNKIKDGFSTYLDLLTNYKPLETDGLYQIFSPLYDTLDYVTANYSKIAPLLKNANYRGSMLVLFNEMLTTDNKAKYAGFVAAHFDELTAFANQDLKEYLAHRDSIYNLSNTPYHYLQLMKAVKNKPLTASFTATLIKGGRPQDYLSEAIITRLQNKLPVQQQAINRVLDTIGLRYGMLEALQQEKLLSRAPLKYRTQAAFAKTSLYSYIEGQDDGSPGDITLLGTLTEKLNTYYVFKFDLADYEEGTGYIAICGPYKTGATTLDFKSYRAYTNWDKKGANWQKQARKMIPDLKKFVAEDLKR
jgi:uncharacterized protein YbaP (TraB family)